MMSKKEIIIYTDGGCRGNQLDKNIGAWAGLLIFGNKEKEIYGTDINTTNNKMELTAVLESLKCINDYSYPITLYSDSAYVCNAFNKGWLQDWIKRGWKTKSKKPVKNQDLWKPIVNIVSQIPDIKFVWIKGHNGDKGNTRVDELVNIAMDKL